MRAAILVAMAVAALGCGPRSSRPARPTERAPSRATSAVSTEATSEPAPPEPEPDWRAAYADRPAMRTLRGRVSYYHDSLAGNSTASGEPYDPRAFTAASRDLPFGTVLRVVRDDTGASAIVRVNDRGPFGRRRRLLDLSRAAAEELGMIERGVIEARAEVLELGPRRR